MRYVLHGVNLEIPRRLEHWPAADEMATPGIMPWDVTLAFGSDLDDTATRPPTGQVHVQWIEEAGASVVYVRGDEISSQLRIAVDRSCRSIHVAHTWPDEGRSVIEALDLVNRWVVADLAREESGAVPLHAAVVLTDVGAVALLGASGRGKSSLAAAMVASGGDVFCDEPACVVVNEGGDGARVLAGVQALRVGDDCLDVFDRAGRPRPPCQVDSYGKLVLGPDTTVSPPDAPLAALVLLDDRRAEGDSIQITRLSPANAAGRLMVERYAQADVAERVRADFTRVAALASVVPTYTASLRDDRSRLLDAAADLLEVLTTDRV